jgi:hypothetical protein
MDICEPHRKHLFLYCCIYSALHSNGIYLIVTCVFVVAGMCLPSRCPACHIWSWDPTDSEPRITVVVRTSSNLPDWTTGRDFHFFFCSCIFTSALPDALFVNQSKALVATERRHVAITTNIPLNRMAKLIMIVVFRDMTLCSLVGTILRFYSLLSLFWRMKLGLWYNLAVCASLCVLVHVCPLLTLECLNQSLRNLGFMTPEPISTAYSINCFHQSMSICVFPLVARQWLGDVIVETLPTNKYTQQYKNCWTHHFLCSSCRVKRESMGLSLYPLTIYIQRLGEHVTTAKKNC